MDAGITVTVVDLRAAIHSFPTPTADAGIASSSVDASPLVLAGVGLAVVFFGAGVAISIVVFIANTAATTTHCMI
jgi:hypothetical protein